MNRRLITSALPYVNNIPHLGNLIQVLSADVFARFCRIRGYETLYVCGTDEYGTATETRAREEGKTPQALCDQYHAVHADIYRWFGISFDHFGRTSTPQQTEIVQSLFADLDRNGYIREHAAEQLFCPECGRFLADRYVRGKCPACSSEDARGDQCERCGKLLDPTDLVEPRCATCGATPRLKLTKHLYIDLPGIQARYDPWMTRASEKGRWTKNAVQMTRSWLRDGLRERAITRDLTWGIPVPKPGYENKVFYVWFDAPIGYMSLTKALADKLAAEGKLSFDWKSWWLPEEAADNVGEVELFQFIGKDNIPFHTVLFPSTLIGSGRNWTKPHHLSSTEYLNYEVGKFSKSKGVGVFGSDAKDSGIPADAWRFYLFYNRPEKADAQFSWSDFQERYNGELIGNLGNLVNRTLTFVSRYYGRRIPAGAPPDTDLIIERMSFCTPEREWKEKGVAIPEQIVRHLGYFREWAKMKGYNIPDPITKHTNYHQGKIRKNEADCFEQIVELNEYLREWVKNTKGIPEQFVELSALLSEWVLWTQVREKEAAVTALLEWAEIKDAFHTIFEIADLANKAFQAGEPWKKRESAPAEAAALIRDLCYVVKDLAILLYPYMPQYSARVLSFFGAAHGAGGLSWKNLGETEGLERVERTEIIFKPLDSAQIGAYRLRYSGSQAERAASAKAAKTPSAEPAKAADPEAHFNAHIRLTAARIVGVERHPEADKLYIEKLDDGSGAERTILSGLVPYLSPEELLDKTVVIADNLKPRTMRGIESFGMLLAADYTDGTGKACIEVLSCPWAAPGTPVVLEGADPAVEKDAQIGIDAFCAVDIAVRNHEVLVGGRRLVADGKPLLTEKTVNGAAH
jgi:methionine--tRNA ligase/methionine--tRNA ligase beta chain